MANNNPHNFGVKAPPMSIVNVVTAETLEAQFNPAELEEVLGATYAHLTVPGLSHTRKHFVNTNDVVYNFELFNHCRDSGGGSLEAMQKIRAARRFLYAACHPWRADGIKRGGAPRLLFVWPQLLSLTCVITGLTFKYTGFNKNNAPTAWTAKVTLEQMRDEFVSMEDILTNGTGSEP